MRLQLGGHIVFCRAGFLGTWLSGIAPGTGQSCPSRFLTALAAGQCPIPSCFLFRTADENDKK